MNIKINKYLIYPFLAFAIIMPIIFDRSLVSVFTMPKLLALRVFTGIVLLILALFFYKKSPLEFYKTKLNYFTILYALWVIIATIFSSAFFISVLGIEGRFIGVFTVLNLLLIFFISMHFFSDKTRAFYFLIAASLAGIITSVFGLFQFSYAAIKHSIQYLAINNGDLPFYFYLSQEKISDISQKVDAGVLSNTQIAIYLFYLTIFICLGLIISFTLSFKSTRDRILAASGGLLVYLGTQYAAHSSAIKSWTQAPQFRVFSTIGHGNHFGGFLVACIAMTTAAFFIVRKKSLKIFFAVAIILEITTLIFTASRGAIVGLLFALFGSGVVLIIAYRKFLKQYFKKFLIILIAVIILSTAAISIFWQKLNTLPLVYRTKSTIQFILEGNVPDRISWWYSAAEMIKEKPIRGIGLETFRNNFNQYRREDYKLPTNEHYSTTPESVHFELLNIATTQGIPGIIFYLLLIITALFTMIKAIIKAEKNSHKILILGFFAASLAYLGQVLISFGMVSTLSYFYLSLGIGTGVSLSVLKAPTSKVVNYNSKIASVIALIVALSLITLGILHYYSHYYYSQGRIKEGQRMGDEAIQYYKKSIEYLPFYYPSYEGLGNLYLKAIHGQRNMGTVIDFLKISANNYKKAIDYSPGIPHLHSNLAQSYSKISLVYSMDGLNKIEEQEYLELAKKYSENAIKLGPNNPIYSYTYAELLKSHELYAEALAQYQKAVQIDNDFYKEIDYKIALMYFELQNYPEAKKHVETAITKTSDNLDFHYLLTEIEKVMEKPAM